MTTAEILRTARGLIDTPEKWSANGWGAGGLKGPRCMTHALHTALGFDSFKDLASTSARAPAYSVLKRAVGVPIHEFNDAPVRTHTEVLAAFDRAIALAESA